MNLWQFYEVYVGALYRWSRKIEYAPTLESEAWVCRNQMQDLLRKEAMIARDAGLVEARLRSKPVHARGEV